MKSYAVYYDGVQIGTLYDDEETGKQNYIPTDEALAIKDSLFLSEMWTPTGGFTDPIPFFRNRIVNCARFGRGEHVGDVVGYHTDGYRLVRIS